MKISSKILVGLLVFTMVIAALSTPILSYAKVPQPVDNSVNSTDIPLIQMPSISDAMKPGYVDPVVAQAEKMKAKGMSDSAIVAEFAKQEIIFDPVTKDWAKGRRLTPEEMKYWKHNDVSTSSSNELYTAGALSTTLDRPTEQKDACMFTRDFNYCGFSYDMKTGSEAVCSDGNTGTICHYITTHVGNGANGCYEIGVWNYPSGNNYVVFTYSQNEPGVIVTSFHPSPESYHNYCILPNGQQDQYGYIYYAYYDGYMVRSTHMWSRYNQVSECNEEWRYTDVPSSFTNDNSRAIFQNQRLYAYQFGYITTLNWGSNIPDQPGTPYASYPQHYSRSMNGNSWKFETWSQY